MLLNTLTVEAPAPGPADWNDEGVVKLPAFISHTRRQLYELTWAMANGFYGLAGKRLHASRVHGWPDCTPYMRHPEILDLVAPLEPVLEELVGEPMGMHLNLTGWVSTLRDWHQDSYLNEPGVGDFYAAVWIALDDIDPDSGVFQYVPGSHRWPQVTRELIGQHVDLTDPQWPKHSEEVLTPLFTELIAEQGEVVSHIPEAGDVLIWHGRLLHRGSTPLVEDAYRPGFIAHFSGINHRPTMPQAVRYDGGGWYFPIIESGSVR